MTRRVVGLWWQTYAGMGRSQGGKDAERHQ